MNIIKNCKVNALCDIIMFRCIMNSELLKYSLLLEMRLEIVREEFATTIRMNDFYLDIMLKL